MKMMKHTAFALFVTLCSGCASVQSPADNDIRHQKTGQLGDVCARVDTPQCEEGLFCRPGQDRVSRCVTEQFAQKGEVCGTFGVIECDAGLTCEMDEKVFDGAGICVRTEP